MNIKLQERFSNDLRLLIQKYIQNEGVTAMDIIAQMEMAKIYIAMELAQAIKPDTTVQWREADDISTQTINKKTS